jgi:hypothetical protein
LLLPVGGVSNAHERSLVFKSHRILAGHFFGRISLGCETVIVEAIFVHLKWEQAAGIIRLQQLGVTFNEVKKYFDGS